MSDFTLLAGTANPGLAQAIARELGVPLGACRCEQFPDGEVGVQLLESVRHQSVFILQSTSPPVNDHLVELLAIADASRRAAARQLTAIVPYFGYARADKRQGRRSPITASLVAELLQVAGINEVVTLDLHAPQIEGFFRLPVDSLTAVPILCEAVRPQLPSGVVVVSPDSGRVQMATQYAQRLDTRVVVLHKKRESGTQTEVTRVVGDVRNRPCLLVDDMISTGGTLERSVEALLEAGARPEMFVAATHGLFVREARAKLSQERIKAIFVTDTIAPSQKNWLQLQVVSVAPLLAQAIGRLAGEGSLSELAQG